MSDLVERLEMVAKIHRDMSGQSALEATIREAAAELRRVREAPVGEIRRVRFDEDERPTWHVVDDRDAVPLNEPKRVRLVPGVES